MGVVIAPLRTEFHYSFVLALATASSPPVPKIRAVTSNTILHQKETGELLGSTASKAVAVGSTESMLPMINAV